MVKRQVTSTTEDSMALTDAVARGLENYKADFGTTSANDMVMQFNGSKSELAQALAGTTDKSSSAYKTQMKNISRWMNYEKGERGKQARSPGGKATQARFRDIRANRNPPRRASVTITGWIGYDNDWRWRTVGIENRTPITLSGNGLSQFLESMQAGNTRNAYQEIWNAYGAGMLSVTDENPEVHIDFE